MDYETGVLVAFLIWLYRVGAAVIVLNSRMAANLRKVGMRVSMTTLSAKPMSDSDRKRSWVGSLARFLVVALIGLAGVFFSWLSVVTTVGFFLYAKSKDAGQPAAVREFRWKLRNLDMSFEQLAKEMYALNQAIGLTQPEFEQYRADLWASAAGGQHSY